MCASGRCWVGWQKAGGVWRVVQERMVNGGSTKWRVSGRGACHLQARITFDRYQIFVFRLRHRVPASQTLPIFRDGQPPQLPRFTSIITLPGATSKLPIMFQVGSLERLPFGHFAIERSHERY